MSRRVVAVLLFAALGMVGALPRPAQADDDAARRAAIASYIAALGAQDLNALRQVIHPASLACIDDANRDYFDFLFANELRHGPDVKGKVRIARLEPVVEGSFSALGMPGLVAFPVKPSYEVQIDVERSAYNYLALVRPLALHDQRWHIVHGCPSDKGLAMFREAQKRREAQRTRAEQLASELSEPARSEIRELIAQGRRISAAQRLQETTGFDLTTATLVVDVLGGKQP
jgi:hypothetical protein